MLRKLAAALLGLPQAPASSPVQLARAQVPEHLHDWLAPAADEQLTTSRELNLKVELTSQTPQFGGRAAGRGKPAEAAPIVGEIGNFNQLCALTRTVRDSTTRFELSETVTPQGGTALTQNFFSLALRPTAQGALFEQLTVAGQSVPLTDKTAINALRLIDEFATTRLRGLTFDPAKKTEQYFGHSRALEQLKAARRRHLLTDELSRPRVQPQPATRPAQP